MSNRRIRDGKGHRAYRRQRDQLRRRVAREGLTCAWCGEPFDLTLPDTSAQGFTADHPVALGRGGKLVGQELAPFHNRCNVLKSDHAEVEIWGAS
jgi:5-methylcytosine-specific restriction endonuclease McrA